MVVREQVSTYRNKYLGSKKQCVQCSHHPLSHEAPVEFLPYAPAAFMTNMAHMTRKQRRSLEREWQRMNEQSIARGEDGIEMRIENGMRVMQSYNRCRTINPEEQIRMVRCISRMNRQ